jgi:hypothetical protein
MMTPVLEEAKKSLPDLSAEHVQKYSTASCRILVDTANKRP